MQHLSALDALFLYVETPDMPMHVGSLILFELPAGHRGSFHPAVRAHVAARMHLAPLFTRKLAFIPLDLANPVWVEDAAVDLDHHLKRVVLPGPGTDQQLEALVAKLHQGMLDRDRPLWEFTVIEGLPGGRVGFHAKIHHAALDGQGGVALAQAVLDAVPHPPAPPAPARRIAESRPPSSASLLGAALRHTVVQYGRILRALPGVARMARDAGIALLSPSQAGQTGVAPEPGTDVPVAAGARAGARLEQIVRSLLGKIPGGIALGPRTPLNHAIGPGRDFVGTRLPLAETKAIARHFGVKLNDVVLAVCAGALRQQYARRPALLRQAMIGAVPASLRAPGETAHGNLVTMMLVNIATDIADPRERLAAIAASSGRAKAITGGMKSVIPTDMPSLGLPWLLGAIPPLYRTAARAERIPVIANLVVSNIPGPQVPMYLAGAKMLAYFPLSIVIHGLALNITILSYDGSLDCGLVACRNAVPDLRGFAAHMQAAHRELLDLVHADEAGPTGRAGAVEAVPAAGAAQRSAERKKRA